LKTFSDQTIKPGYRLRRYRLRNRIFREFCRGISQREIAIELRIHRDTVARLLNAVAKEARKQNDRVRATLNPKIVVMDEMETFEHTKCKPVSIVVAVEEGTRKIIALRAAQMPAKGRLAEVSRRKYGYRADHRPTGTRIILSNSRRNSQSGLIIWNVFFFSSIIFIGFSVSYFDILYNYISDLRRERGTSSELL
jgi:hypothetical protein